MSCICRRLDKNAMTPLESRLLDNDANRYCLGNVEELWGRLVG
jgi:hypothetical protein